MSVAACLMLQGGKLTSPQQPDLVKLVKMGSEEKLWYRAPKKIHVALLRGSTADLDGNISFERETLYLDGLNQVGWLLCICNINCFDMLSTQN